MPWYPANNEIWATIEGSEICASGREQSPIDLPELDLAVQRNVLDPVFNPIEVMVTDTGHSLKWNM